eukprot:tig00000788_g4066.t1
MCYLYVASFESSLSCEVCLQLAPPLLLDRVLILILGTDALLLAIVLLFLDRVRVVAIDLQVAPGLGPGLRIVPPAAFIAARVPLRIAIAASVPAEIALGVLIS